MLTVGSLFTGCYGLDLGLELTGWYRVRWAYEIEPACRRVVGRHYPELVVYEDVRELDALADPVDVVVGGFPCQDLSYAGSGAGLGGDRSGLWSEMARAVRLFRPRLVLVENVSGLVTRGLGRVVYDLADVGYVGRWLRVRAADVGAPHRRERIFILATDAAAMGRREGAGLRAAAGTNGDARFGRRRPDDDRSEDVSDADVARSQRAESARRPDLSAGRGRPAAADADGRRREIERVEEPTGLAGAPRRESDGRAAIGRVDDAAAIEWGPYRVAVERWARILGRPAPRPTDDRGRLEPSFVEWMLGFPDGWTAGEKRTARLRMLGNAVQVQVGEYVGRLLLELGEVAA